MKRKLTDAQILRVIRTYNQERARLGGLVRSAAKARAARVNGKRGGRPKKDKPGASRTS